MTEPRSRSELAIRFVAQAVIIAGLVLLYGMLNSPSIPMFLQETRHQASSIGLAKVAEGTTVLSTKAKLESNAFPNSIRSSVEHGSQLPTTNSLRMGSIGLDENLKVPPDSKVGAPRVQPQIETSQNDVSHAATIPSPTGQAVPPRFMKEPVQSIHAFVTAVTARHLNTLNLSPPCTQLNIRHCRGIVLFIRVFTNVTIKELLRLCIIVDLRQGSS